MLVGERRLPKRPPSIDDPTEEEAQWIVGATRLIWQRTEGAIDWVKATRAAADQVDPARTGPALLLSPYP